MTIDIEKIAVDFGTELDLSIYPTDKRYLPKYQFSVYQLQEFTEAYAQELKAENEALRKDAMRQAITVKDAMNALTFYMKNDADYFQTWICNIAMLLKDAGVEHKEANERSIDFMSRAFGVRQSIQLDDFTMPPINLPSIGRAK
jgi:hypothetical protein